MGIKKIKTELGTLKWEVRAYENGRGSKRIQRTFDRKIDAEAFLLSYNQKKAESKHHPNEGYKSFHGKTLESEALIWLSDGEHRFSIGHMVRCRALLQKEVLPKFGSTPMEEITPDFMRRYQQAELKKGLLPPSVNRKTEILMAILNFSLRQQRIPYHPALGFRKLRYSKPEMLFWNIDEAQSFLRFTNQKYPPGSEKRWVHCVYLTALNTAARAAEIWAIRPMDISLNGQTILLRRQLNRITKEFKPIKSTHQARPVPCNQELFAELKNLIATKHIGHQQTIFQNDEGNPICHDNFTDRTFEKDLKQWGGRKIRFHDMRHTAATLLVANGVDIKTVKEICGHTTIQTTMNYAHLVGGIIEKVSETFQISATKGGVAG